MQDAAASVFYVAAYPYEAQGPQELTLKQGDRLKYVHTHTHTQPRVLRRARSFGGCWQFVVGWCTPGALGVQPRATALASNVLLVACCLLGSLTKSTTNGGKPVSTAGSEWYLLASSKWLSDHARLIQMHSLFFFFTGRLNRHTSELCHLSPELN